MRPASIRILAPFAALAAALIAAPSAAAKVACTGVHPEAEIALRGLPPVPEADVPYRVELTVPDAPHANPEPLMMLLRCGDPNDVAGPGEHESVSRALSGAGPATITLRFPDAGRWRGALMDRGGKFHSLGTFRVRAPSATATSPPAEDAGGGGPGLALLLGSLLVGGTGVAMLARRRLA